MYDEAITTNMGEENWLDEPAFFLFLHFDEENKSHRTRNGRRKIWKSQDDNTLKITGGSLFRVPAELILHSDLKSDTL